jgi:hypothetical protein
LAQALNFNLDFLLYFLSIPVLAKKLNAEAMFTDTSWRDG